MVLVFVALVHVVLVTRLIAVVLVLVALMLVVHVIRLVSVFVAFVDVVTGVRHERPLVFPTQRAELPGFESTKLLTL